MLRSTWWLRNYVFDVGEMPKLALTIEDHNQESFSHIEYQQIVIVTSLLGLQVVGNCEKFMNFIRSLYYPEGRLHVQEGIFSFARKSF